MFSQDVLAEKLLWLLCKICLLLSFAWCARWLLRRRTAKSIVLLWRWCLATIAIVMITAFLLPLGKRLTSMSVFYVMANSPPRPFVASSLSDSTDLVVAYSNGVVDRTFTPVCL